MGNHSDHLSLSMLIYQDEVILGISLAKIHVICNLNVIDLNHTLQSLQAYLLVKKDHEHYTLRSIHDVVPLPSYYTISYPYPLLVALVINKHMAWYRTLQFLSDICLNNIQNNA